MTTNPTNGEQALPDKCIHCDESIVVLHAPGLLARCYEGYMHHEEAKDTIVSALSSRDAEVREVLEGLRNEGGCWCRDGNPPRMLDHSPACLATQALYPKLQAPELQEASRVE